jgi:hypothetical protein
VDDPKTGAAWGARTFTTHVQLGLTDYTRFGVSWSVATANSFAYSPLPQVEYEDHNAPGYPGGSRAKYTGDTVVKDAGNVPYEGRVEVDVSWSSTGIEDSEITVTFSELAKVADSEPFSIGYILVDNNGARFLKNGLTAGTAGQSGTQVFIDYHGYETMNDGKYRGLDDTAQVSITEDQPDANTGIAIQDPVVNANLQMSKDPRNGFADMVRFDVAEIKFRKDVTVATDIDDLLMFSGSDADIDIIWDRAGFANTTLDGDSFMAKIEGQFVGQGDQGPLAAMGIWSFVTPTGVLEAMPMGTLEATTLDINADGDTNDAGEGADDRYPGWKDGTVAFKSTPDAEDEERRFDPNVRRSSGDLINAVDALGAVQHTVDDTTAYDVSDATDATGYLTKTVDGVTSFGGVIHGAFGTGP